MRMLLSCCRRGQAPHIRICTGQNTFTNTMSHKFDQSWFYLFYVRHFMNRDADFSLLEWQIESVPWIFSLGLLFGTKWAIGIPFSQGKCCICFLQFICIYKILSFRYKTYNNEIHYLLYNFYSYKFEIFIILYIFMIWNYQATSIFI